MVYSRVVDGEPVDLFGDSHASTQGVQGIQHGSTVQLVRSECTNICETPKDHYPVCQCPLYNHTDMSNIKDYMALSYRT